MAAKKEAPEVPAVTGAEEDAIDRGEEYVRFMIPLSADNAAVFIGVNGETVRVRPGENVYIKRKFAEAYNHSVAQQNSAWKAQIAAQNASRKALADL